MAEKLVDNMEEGSKQSLNYIRTKEVIALKAEGKNPYPHKFNPTIMLSQFQERYSKMVTDESYDQSTAIDQLNKIKRNSYVTTITESIIGRVVSLREVGKKLIFFVIMSESINVQLLVNFAICSEQAKQNVKLVRRGDIVGVSGHPGLSKTNELSLYVVDIERLVPTLHDLPTSFFGIQDGELRARNRFLDLMVNPLARHPFVTKTHIIKQLRYYLDNNNFLEVHTPILSSLASGANAKPFKTYHNDLKMNMVMRIAPELYLKQLIVGGFERVYEIGPQFRNESVDDSHNPEFMSLELYQVGVDYIDLMEMCESMMSFIVKNIKGSYKFTYTPHGSDTPVEIDFTPPFRRLDFIEEIEKATNTKIPTDLTTEDARKFLVELCKQHNVECANPQTTPRLLDKLCGKFVESQCINPTFIINHPLIMSPLAKWHREKPHLTERFELFVLGTEYANAYTELNDPFIQKQTFELQMKDKANGDEEAQEIDHTFIKALEYGLPPTGGFGMGIDRFAMLLSNVNNIRDVILFPTLKDK